MKTGNTAMMRICKIPNQVKVDKYKKEHGDKRITDRWNIQDDSTDEEKV